MGSQPSSAAVADFNGDGKLDVACSILQEDTVNVLVGNGLGRLSPAGPVVVAQPNPITFPASLAIASGDFNGDGRGDVAVLGNSNVAVMLNHAGQTLASPIANSIGTAKPAAGFAVADLTGIARRT